MPSLLAVVVAVAVFGAVAIGFRRVPQVMSVVVICGFAVQPTLVFFISSVFGPAKDAIVRRGAAGAACECLFWRSTARAAPLRCLAGWRDRRAARHVPAQPRRRSHRAVV